MELMFICVWNVTHFSVFQYNSGWQWLNRTLVDSILHTLRILFWDVVLGPYTLPSPPKISIMPPTLMCAYRGTKGRPCGKWVVATIGWNIEFEMVICSFLLSLLPSIPLSFTFIHFSSFHYEKSKQDRQTDNRTGTDCQLWHVITWNLDPHFFSQLQTSKADASEEDPKLCIQRLRHQVRTLQCQLRDQGWTLRDLQAARDEAVGLQDKLKNKVGWANPSFPPKVSRPQGASTNSLRVLARDLKNRVMCMRKARDLEPFQPAVLH